MIRHDFLAQVDRRTLEAQGRREREDHGFARRANARLLLDDGKSCQEIAELLYLVDDTIRSWLLGTPKYGKCYPICNFV